MKKLLILLILVFSSINSSNAFAAEDINYPMAIGLEAGYKMGINAADVPQGVKNAVGMAKLPDFGVQFYMPFQGSNKMGLLANLGYYTFPYAFTYENIGGDFKYNYSYLAFGADFFVSGFTIGVNYGMPASASLNDFDINTSSLASAFEFRLGTHIPLIENNSGRLNLNIRASYFLTGQLEQSQLIAGKNTNPASLFFGLSYLFNLQPVN